MYVKVLTKDWAGLCALMVVVHCDVAGANGAPKVNGTNRAKVKSKRLMPCVCFLFIFVPPYRKYLNLGRIGAPVAGYRTTLVTIETYEPGCRSAHYAE